MHDAATGRGAVPEALLECVPWVEAWLDRHLPGPEDEPRELHEAMRYSVFSGGKRLRGALAVLAGRLFDPDPEAVAPVAAALEMVHAYSLIHDDLPCMDDDDLRRGKPTCHKVFGEALAVLAGDALLTRGFEVLAEVRRRARVGALIAELGRAAGAAGMVGGQVLDLRFTAAPAEGARALERADVEGIHRRKTGALLAASVVLGAIAGGAEARAVERLRRYGEALGLAFQIADDVLDETAGAEELGKTPGKDRAAGKATFPAALGLDGARAAARECLERALDALADLNDEEGTHALRQLARFAVERQH